MCTVMTHHGTDVFSISELNVNTTSNGTREETFSGAYRYVGSFLQLYG